MTAGHVQKGATHIVFYAPYNYYYSNTAYTLTIICISFSCTTGSICEIGFRDVQQLFIKDCTFQGIKLYLNRVANAMIFQTCFYNGSGLDAYSSSINITRCTFRNNMRVIYFSSYSNYNNVLTISESTFINNTLPYTGGFGAVMYISISGYSRVLINASTFVNNTAVTREGGALYIDGNLNAATAIYITKSTFIYNSANSSNCGAISAQDINVNITESDFYYNRANGDGGVVCVRSANIDVSKSTFVHNYATGNGGVFLLEESNTYINSALFKNNKAGQDGGTLATYVYPSTYEIIQSTFTDNHAEDDGGAVFIGCAESILRVRRSTFNN